MAIRTLCHASGMTPSRRDGQGMRIATAPSGLRNDEMGAFCNQSNTLFRQLDTPPASFAVHLPYCRGGLALPRQCADHWNLSSIQPPLALRAAPLRGRHECQFPIALTLSRFSSRKGTTSWQAAPPSSMYCSRLALRSASVSSGCATVESRGCKYSPISRPS